MICLRPIHHVLEYERVYRLLADLRARGPGTELVLHFRSALRDDGPFQLLPANRVQRIADRGPRGTLAAALRGLAAELGEGACSFAMDRPGFRDTGPDGGPGDEAAEAFLAALRCETPQWLTGPEHPAAPLARQTPVALLVHIGRFDATGVLWLTPLLREIRRRFPEAEITLVAPPVASDLLARNRRVAHLQTYHPREGEAGRRRVLAALAGHGFDAALFALGRDSRSRWLAEAAAAWEVPYRIDVEFHGLSPRGEEPDAAFTHEGRFFRGAMAVPRMLLHVLDPLLKPEPREERFSGDRRSELHVPEDALWWARELLEERGIGREPFAVLAPGGPASRRWPAESFARLAVLLTRHFGMHVIVEGTPDEAGLLAEIEAAVRQETLRRRIVFATDSLAVLGALFERARLLVSNDDLPIHLGEAVAVPTLYFARPEDLAHSHPRTRACWALYDDVGGVVRNITVNQALGAVRRMVQQGLVRGLAS